jgi:hypothetical protein
MDVVLGPEVREYTINYIDDLLIVSNSSVRHHDPQRIFFIRFSPSGTCR